MKRIWQFFCSLHLSIYLGLGLCVLLWVGSGYFLSSGQELAALNEELLITWLYQQGWKGLATNWWLWLVILVILFLAINTLVCSIDRLIKLIPRLVTPKLDVKPQWLASLAMKQEFSVSAPLEEVKLYLRKALAFKGYKKLHSQEQENGDWVFYSQKGRWMTLAPYLTHLGFLLVLTGHLVSSSSGFKSFGHWVGLGEKLSLPHSTLWLRLESVGPCSEKDPDDYCSKIVLGEGTDDLHTAELGMNTPAFFRGLNIYQVSWEQEARGLEITITQEGKSKQLSLLPGEQKEIAPGISILPYAVLPDFTFGPDGSPTSKSGVFKNPAMLLMVLENSMPVKQGWLFLHKSEFQQQYYKGIKMTFSGLATTSYLLLNIARNPGAHTVLAGGVLFILASIWILVGNYRRLWFYLEEEDGKVKLTCAGLATQRQARLKSKMTYICDALVKHFPTHTKLQSKT